MSDELRKAFEEMKKDLGAVKERLSGAEAGLREARESFNRRMETVEDGLHEAGSRFDAFLVRFNEVSEMLVTHDTEQLQRVTKVENENAAIKQQWKDLAARVEALEKRLPPEAA